MEVALALAREVVRRRSRVRRQRRRTSHLYLRRATRRSRRRLRTRRSSTMLRPRANPGLTKLSLLLLLGRPGYEETERHSIVCCVLQQRRQSLHYYTPSGTSHYFRVISDESIEISIQAFGMGTLAVNLPNAVSCTEDDMPTLLLDGTFVDATQYLSLSYPERACLSDVQQHHWVWCLGKTFHFLMSHC